MLGCLIEKQLTTPQHYPLTLNALVGAATQSTSRDPVVMMTDDDVLQAIDELRAAHLARVVLPSHGRSVNRYRQVTDETWGLDANRAGLLSLLLLRGPQTLGELRSRGARMIDGGPESDLAGDLAALAEHPDGLVELLARRPGQKEDRWRQIAADPWEAPAGNVWDQAHRDDSPTPPTVAAMSAPTAAPPSGSDYHRDITDLERQVADVRSEVARLRDEVQALRARFDS